MNGDVIKISLLMLDGQTQFVNTFHYLDDGSAHDFDSDVVAADFEAAWVPLWQPFALSSTTLYQVRAEIIYGPGIGRVSMHKVFPAQIGSHGGAGIDNELCISMKRQTGYTGPKNRGRIFLGPVSPDYLSDEQLGEVIPVDPDLEGIRAFMATSPTLDTVVVKPVLVSSAGVVNPNHIVRADWAKSVTRRKSRILRFPN